MTEPHEAGRDVGRQMGRDASRLRQQIYPTARTFRAIDALLLMLTVSLALAGVISFGWSIYFACSFTADCLLCWWFSPTRREEVPAG